MPRKSSSKTEISPADNSAASIIALSVPYSVRFTIKGTAPFLFHRWNVNAVDEKAKAKKGSAARKSDDLESYVYRDESGALSIPYEYIRMAMVNAGRSIPDPRSPRKSCVDLFKAGIVPNGDLASLGVSEWDYEDRRRVLIQKNAINRTRPAMKAGWEAEFVFEVLASDYIDETLFQRALAQAGQFVGVGDFRPTFGRFIVTHFEKTNV